MYRLAAVRAFRIREDELAIKCHSAENQYLALPVSQPTVMHAYKCQLHNLILLFACHLLRQRHQVLVLIHSSRHAKALKLPAFLPEQLQWRALLYQPPLVHHQDLAAGHDCLRKFQSVGNSQHENGLCSPVDGVQ